MVPLRTYVHVEIYNLQYIMYYYVSMYERGIW